MRYLPDILWMLGALLVFLGVLFGLGASRYRRLSHRIGAFTCDLRRGRMVGHDPQRFSPGVACYGVGRLDWYPAWSLSPVARSSWPRESFEILGRGSAPGRRGQLLVSCRSGGASFDLLMSASAYAGLASWLEAAPSTLPDVI